MAADCAALAGQPGEQGEDQLAAWRSDDHLGELGVPKQERSRVAAALRRLFPILGEQPIAAPHQARSRRQGRRVADPDYVERYFALTPPSDDLSDAVLTQALQEWVDGQPGPAAEQAGAVLRPVRADATACEVAARVVRRAEARAEALSAHQTARLIPIVVGLLPDRVSVPGEPAYRMDNAIVAWLARLFSQADGPPPQDLLDIMKRPAEVSSPLGHFLRALRLAIPEPFELNAWLPLKERSGHGWPSSSKSRPRRLGAGSLTTSNSAMPRRPNRQAGCCSGLTPSSDLSR